MAPERTKIPKGAEKFIKHDPDSAKEAEEWSSDGVSKAEIFRRLAHGKGAPPTHVSGKEDGEKKGGHHKYDHRRGNKK